MTDFGALLAALGEYHVEYLVVGGAAAIAHGSARLTQDLDVVYRRTRENLDRLVAALAAHKPYLRGAPAGLLFVWDRDVLRRGLNFILVTSLGEIDLLALSEPAAVDPGEGGCREAEGSGGPCGARSDSGGRRRMNPGLIACGSA
jgi:hypothetical protein